MMSKPPTARDTPEAENDWVLYARFQKGDTTAFRQLFDRYKNRILNLSYRFVQNTASAEDIAQEVLIKIYEKKAAFRAETKFSTWVYRVTANASLDVIRKRRFSGFSLNQPATEGGEDRVSFLDAMGSGESDSPSKNLEKKELTRAVENALQKLPEHLRAPVILFQFEENTYQEIAEILQISVKAVERRIYHAKQILRGVLSGYLLSRRPRP